LGFLAISALELLVGARNSRELAEIDRFLSEYGIVPLRASIGIRAHELVKSYSKSHNLHVFDSLIAGTAIEEALILVTKNRKHFSMIDGLTLQVPQY
jgi:predicted nucleic acid-binding protein